MKKESFVVYKKFYDPIKNLENEQLGRLFRAIFEFQIYNKECEDKDIKIAFDFFKAQFIVDNEKYEKICEKNRRNGMNGGRPRRTQKTQSVIYEPKKADNDNDSDNDSDILLLTNNNNNIYEFAEQNFGRALSPLEYEKINNWLSLYEENIIKYAIEI